MEVYLGCVLTVIKQFGNLQPVQIAQVYFPPLVRVHMWGKKMGAGQFWEEVSQNINEVMWEFQSQKYVSV